LDEVGFVERCGGGGGGGGVFLGKFVFLIGCGFDLGNRWIDLFWFL